MALIRVCDRCSAQVRTSAGLGVSVPVDSPATRQGQVPAVAFAATLTVQVYRGAPDTPLDLCPVCQASALIEALGVVLGGAGISPKQAKGLVDRASTLVPALVGA